MTFPNPVNSGHPRSILRSRAAQVVRGASRVLGSVVVGALAGTVASLLIFGIWGLNRVGLRALSSNGFGYLYWGINGALFGAVLGPLLRLTLLRGASFSQAVLLPLAGAVLGGSASLVPFRTDEATLNEGAYIPALGAILASALLYRANRRRRRRDGRSRAA